MPRPLTLLLFWPLASCSSQWVPEYRKQTAHRPPRLSALSPEIAWASVLTHLSADYRWRSSLAGCPVPDAAALDFRAVVASPPPMPLNVCRPRRPVPHLPHATPASTGRSSLRNQDPQRVLRLDGFLGRHSWHRACDPIRIQTGQLKFELLTTDDGHTWKPLAPPTLPPALEGKAHSLPATVVSQSRATTSGLPPEAVPPVSSTPPTRQSWHSHRNANYSRA